jgi:hypothetical protein
MSFFGLWGTWKFHEVKNVGRYLDAETPSVTWSVILCPDLGSVMLTKKRRFCILAPKRPPFTPIRRALSSRLASNLWFTSLHSTNGLFFRFDQTCEKEAACCNFFENWGVGGGFFRKFPNLPGWGIPFSPFSSQGGGGVFSFFSEWVYWKGISKIRSKLELGEEFRKMSKLGYQRG